MAIRAFTICIDATSEVPVARGLAQAEVSRFGIDDLAKLVDSPIEPPPHIIVVGKPTGSLSLLEMAQALSLAYPSTPIIHVAVNREGFNRAELQKNGIFDAYLVPFEEVELEKCIADIGARVADAAEKALRPVKIIDFQGEDPLEFDTFVCLPLNKKYVRYTRSGKSLNPDQVQKLKKCEVNSLFVQQKDMPKFYQYTAQQLVNLGRSETIGETEKQERLQQSVRTIVSDLFAETSEQPSFENGRKLMGNCQEVVKSYIAASKGTKGTSFYEKVTSLVKDDGGVYSQVANAATFSSLFSIGLQIGDPEEVAMAALLCDIGIADLPPEVQRKDPSERSREEEAFYRTHPTLSVAQIQRKRMLVSEKVIKIILQHHENYNGRGYPEGVPGDRVLPEAQLVSISIELSELIKIRVGKKRMSAREAIEHICKEKSGKEYHPEILRKLKAMLLAPPDAAENAA